MFVISSHVNENVQEDSPFSTMGVFELVGLQEFFAFFIRAGFNKPDSNISLIIIFLILSWEFLVVGLLFLVESLAGTFDLAGHVFVDIAIIGLIVFVCLLCFVDFSVEREDIVPSFA